MQHADSTPAGIRLDSEQIALVADLFSDEQECYRREIAEANEPDDLDHAHVQLAAADGALAEVAFGTLTFDADRLAELAADYISQVLIGPASRRERGSSAQLVAAGRLLAALEANR